jgi:vacuolar protein sorting-associated protein 45
MSTDLLDAFRRYAQAMLKIPSLEGMKAILLDEEATKMFGLTMSLTEIISQDVVIVGKLIKGTTPDSTGTSLQGAQAEKGATRHLKCVVVLRPVASSIQALCQQLRNPQFNSYYIFFTNNVSDEQLRPIADADHKHELVRQVHIHYMDYYPLESQLYISSTPPQQFPLCSLQQQRDFWPGFAKTAFDRNIDTITSLILTIKAHPVLRTSNSRLANTFAQEISRRMSLNTDLYHFPQANNDQSTLLILDRRDDPITPLLLNWSYLSMINELLPIDNNRVDLRMVPNIDPELKELTLSTNKKHDSFFAANMYSGFGDIASNAKKLVDEYKTQKQAATGKMDTLEDIRSAVEKVPELKQMAGTVSKHMTILLELNRQIKVLSLYHLSELAQDIACENNHTAHVESIKKILYGQQGGAQQGGKALGAVTFDYKLYMVMLYALKYETEPSNKIAEFKQSLMTAYPTNLHKITAIDAVLAQCGAKNRSQNTSLTLQHGRSLFAKMSSKVSSSVKGYENVHTRHKPLLVDIIEQLAQQRAKAVDFPQTSTFAHKTSGQPNSQEVIVKPNYIYVYIVGGVTYGEAAAVHAFNQTSNDVKVALGGSCILNARSFIQSLIGEDKGTGSSDSVALDML